MFPLSKRFFDRKTVFGLLVILFWYQNLVDTQFTCLKVAENQRFWRAAQESLVDVLGESSVYPIRSGLTLPGILNSV